MRVNAYKCVLEHIYTHYHGGYVFISSANFFWLVIRYIFIRNFFFGNVFVGTEIFRPSPHMIALKYHDYDSKLFDSI